MSYTSYAVGDAEAEIQWAKTLYSSAAFRTVMMDPQKDLCRSESNDGANALICAKDEFKRGGGTVRTTLYDQIGGRGFLGNEVAQGRGQTLTSSTFDMTINQLRQNYGIAGRIDQQYIPWNLLKIGDTRMADWLFTRMDVAVFAQLCGSSVLPSSAWVDAANHQVDATDQIYTGQNPTSTPTTLGDRIFRPAGVATDELLTTEATHKLTTVEIDKARRIAREVSPPIRKVRFMGRSGYILFISPGQGKNLLEDTKYTDQAGQLLQGGQKPTDTIWFSGGYHPYKDVYIIETNLLAPGQNSSTAVAVAETRRAVFCGAQSMMGAWGIGYDKNRFYVITETTDGGNRMERFWGSICGFKAPTFDVNELGTVDFAKIVIPTFEPTI